MDSFDINTMKMNQSYGKIKTIKFMKSKKKNKENIDQNPVRALNQYKEKLDKTFTEKE